MFVEARVKIIFTFCMYLESTGKRSISDVLTKIVQTFFNVLFQSILTLIIYIHAEILEKEKKLSPLTLEGGGSREKKYSEFLSFLTCSNRLLQLLELKGAHGQIIT